MTRAIQEKHSCNFQKELKVELFSKGRRGKLPPLFLSPSTLSPSVYLTRQKKMKGGGDLPPYTHTQTNPPEEWLASMEEMRPDNLPFPPAAGCQKRALFLLRDLLPKMPGIKKEKTAGHCCVT